MTIVLLASVSLFALVVTSRPIPSDSGLSEFAPASSIFQTAVQTVFHIRPGKGDLKLDAARIHSQTPNQQIEYLSELNAGDIASFEISPRVKPSFEALLDETADRHNALDTNNALDGSRADHTTDGQAVTEYAVDGQQKVPIDESPTAPLIVLVFSCVAAFLVLACIALMLYVIKSLRAQMLALKTAWELFPRFWRHPTFQKTMNATAKKHILGDGCLLLRTEVGQRRLDTDEASAERYDLHTEDKPLYFDAVSDIESELDDLDEKSQDTLDMTPLPLTHDLPLEEHVSYQSHFDAPSLPSLGSYPLDQPTGDRGPQMRRLCSSLVCRPAWSVRVVDSPPLGLSSREIGGVNSTLQPLIHPRGRAYRSGVPEFDVALAMQLRPGLGIGANSAWMARFLMAIFGWFAVALTSNTQ